MFFREVENTLCSSQCLIIQLNLVPQISKPILLKDHSYFPASQLRAQRTPTGLHHLKVKTLGVFLCPI